MAAESCLGELLAARDRLVSEGFSPCPTWRALSEGARPPKTESKEAGEFSHGWQYHASAAIERNRRCMLLRSLCRARRALLRSQSGPGAGLVLETAPTGPEVTLTPERFLAVLRRRLRWPLILHDSACEGCGGDVDQYGDHLSSCMRSGRVQRRAGILERAVAKICREAGARVKLNARLVDMNIAVAAADERRIEVLASGLQCCRGAQLAIDATLRCVCHRDGAARARADWQDGAVIADASAEKRAKYHELAAGGRCRLVVFAVETGGRIGAEALELIDNLARVRAQASPQYLRGAVAFALSRRWTRIAAVAAANAWSSGVLDKGDVGEDNGGTGPFPWMQDVLSEARLEDLPPRM